MEDYKDLTQIELNNKFIDACRSGDLEVVKYLLMSPELRKHANIHSNNDYAFRRACKIGNFKIVKYLSASPELKEHANIREANDDGFIWACVKEHINIVKYLLTSHELKEHPNIHVSDDYAFKEVCHRGNVELIKFFVFDMSIEKTKEIDKYLAINGYEEIENLFKIRDLNKQLEGELNFSYNNKKNKI